MSSRFRPGYAAAVCALAGIGILSGATAVAAVVTFTVDSSLDQIDDDTADGLCHTTANTCTLRAAVMQANLASGAGANILLPAGTYVLTRPAQGANGPDNGDLNFTTPAAGNPVITITGAGSASTIVDANQIDRVLTIAVGRVAILSRLTLRNGYLSRAESGGGVDNSGSLTLDRCAISNNTAVFPAGSGGGIFNDGPLSVNDSSVTGNSTDYAGGGIYTTAGQVAIVRSSIADNTAILDGGGIISGGTSTLSISDSTISRNESHRDGGGLIASGLLIVTNSTLSANSAWGDGGGLYYWSNVGSANVYSSTIVDNGADADADVNGGIGGGIYVVAASSFNLSNTLVAGNTLFNQPIYDDCWGTLTSYRTNLFWEVSALCTISTGGGFWGYLFSLASLGPLQRNGGSTETLALLPGSNAIDAGDATLGCTGPVNEVLTADQRGAPRAWGVRCDVGAYEAGPLFFDDFESGDLAAW